MMENRSDEEISLFVRDNRTGRFLYNARALQALGIDPAEAQRRGYPTNERSAVDPRQMLDDMAESTL
jgi:hypothetical protein